MDKCKDLEMINPQIVVNFWQNWASIGFAEYFNLVKVIAVNNNWSKFVLFEYVNKSI